MFEYVTLEAYSIKPIKNQTNGRGDLTGNSGRNETPSPAQADFGSGPADPAQSQPEVL